MSLARVLSSAPTMMMTWPSSMAGVAPMALGPPIALVRR
jgi:hypothetical protein